MKKDLINSKAKEVLKSFNSLKVPVPVQEIIEKLGIKVSFAASDKYSGVLIRKSDDTILMGLNSLESFNRQRFTMAHELGHYFLGHNKPVFVDDKVTVNHRENDLAKKHYDPKEADANAFAASLLMPEEFIEKDFEQITKGINVFLDEHLMRLAEKYEVSKEAMKIRLLRLGLIKV